MITNNKYFENNVMLIYNIFHLSAQIVYISQLFPTCGDNDALKPGPRVVRWLTMVEKLQRWITVNFELFRCLVGGSSLPST